MPKKAGLLPYSKLSAKAKKFACREYIIGWLETHPEEKETATLEWADEILRDPDMKRCLFDLNGSLVAF